MNHPGLDIRQLAHHLKASGIPTGERKLRKHLVETGALRKTLLGYEATKKVRERGLIINDLRQHIVTSEQGQQIKHTYTIPIVTGDGIAWLREQLDSTNEMETNQ
jgi:hypothetical protein